MSEASNVDGAAAPAAAAAAAAASDEAVQDPWVNMPRRQRSNGLAGGWGVAGWGTMNGAGAGAGGVQAKNQMVGFDMHAALHDACKAGSMEAFQYVLKLPNVDVCDTLFSSSSSSLHDLTLTGCAR